MSILFFMIPFLLAIFLAYNRSKLTNEPFKIRYGAMYQNLKASRLQAALYNVYYVYRRLIYALTIIYAGPWAGIQLMIQILMSLMHLGYVFANLPFEENIDNRLEIFNESCILLILSCHLAFVTGTEDVETTYNFGFFVIGIIMLNILVNVIMFLITNCRVIYLKVIKPLCMKCIKVNKAPAEQVPDQKIKKKQKGKAPSDADLTQMQLVPGKSFSQFNNQDLSQNIFSNMVPQEALYFPKPQYKPYQFVQDQLLQPSNKPLALQKMNIFDKSSQQQYSFIPDRLTTIEEPFELSSKLNLNQNLTYADRVQQLKQERPDQLQRLDFSRFVQDNNQFKNDYGSIQEDQVADIVLDYEQTQTTGQLDNLSLMQRQRASSLQDNRQRPNLSQNTSSTYQPYLQQTQVHGQYPYQQTKDQSKIYQTRQDEAERSRLQLPFKQFCLEMNIEKAQQKLN